MLRLLCVCTGNTCRSPMFQVLLGDALGKVGIQAEVESAGTGAIDGEPAAREAVTAMARRGLDLSAHRSRALAGLDLAVYDRICCVTSRHAAFVRAQGVPAARIEVLAAASGGIADPFGGDDAVYEACASQLVVEAARIAESLRHTENP